MEKVQNISDISKETLTFLAFFDNKMIEKIPSYIITKLCEEAADSKSDFYIDTSKSFEEQNISEKSKDLLALIYYDYIAEEEEKKEIIEQWELNEEKYNNIQNQKYSYDNLFAKNSQKQEINKTNLPIKVEKENVFKRLIKYIKSILNKNKE